MRWVSITANRRIYERGMDAAVSGDNWWMESDKAVFMRAREDICMQIILSQWNYELITVNNVKSKWNNITEYSVEIGETELEHVDHFNPKYPSPPQGKACLQSRLHRGFWQQCLLRAVDE